MKESSFSFFAQSLLSAYVHGTVSKINPKDIINLFANKFKQIMPFKLITGNFKETEIQFQLLPRHCQDLWSCMLNN